MKKLIALFLYAFILKTTSAQTPQIALVRPSTNQTQIFTTLQNAYSSALNNDYIYLPGGVFSLNDSIRKKIFFIGAGISPDSTIATNITKIEGLVRISLSGSGSSFEGIEFISEAYDPGSGYPFGTIQLQTNTSLSIRSCKVPSIRNGFDMLIVNSIIKNIYNPINSTFNNNIINGIGRNLGYNTYYDAATTCNFNNCIFLSRDSLNARIATYNACSFKNCIFLSPRSIYSFNGLSNTLNCLKPSSTSLFSNNGTEMNSIISNTSSDIFINYPLVANDFDFQFNFYLKPTNNGVNAGTDVTDVGIYGSTNPCQKGWVPSNPHIYFKQVATQSNTNGTLPIIFKVRTNN